MQAAVVIGDHWLQVAGRLNLLVVGYCLGERCGYQAPGIWVHLGVKRQNGICHCQSGTQAGFTCWRVEVDTVGNQPEGHLLLR
mmetsp:Transcript_60077/g.161067  ORF Transcript_60077/g.161067 Transcript_60077/m.161067 type:complete len:83 (+) Transcript_60077:1541-1789(+)